MENPIPLFQKGDRVIPIFPCLLIAGVVIDVLELNNSMTKDKYNYVIKLDRPFDNNGKYQRGIETVQRYESCLEIDGINH